MTASQPAGPPGPAADLLVCPSCASAVAAAERYCEACGADLGRPAPTTAATDGVPAQPVAPDPSGPSAACRECGGVVAEDGYCTRCGARAPSPRNHFSEHPAPWVAAVCDRGIRHTRNEDAVALAADPQPGGRAVLVVCDGVSSSTDSDVASLAAARAARDVLAAAGPTAAGTVATRVATHAKAIVAAADAANDAVITHTAQGPGNPASCTFVAAVVDGSEAVVGWVGDSRAYWLPDASAPRLLTTDDSFAAEQIALGTPRAAAESGPQAHAITRWLGVDAPDHTPRTVSLDLEVAGWLLVCSDGLWNYCSEAHDLAALVATTSRTCGGGALDLAGALVDWANGQGGQDNVTVALAHITPEPPEAAPPPPHREEVEPDGHLRR